MPIPANVVHTVVSGSSAGVEEFAFGWWNAATEAPTDVDLDSSTPFAAFRTSLLAAMTSDQIITAYDAYWYNGSGLAAHVHKSVTHPGTDTTGMLPLQVACVLSLRTATLSRQGRGRIYLPTSGASMMSGSLHQFASAKVDDLVDKFAAYQDAQLIAGNGPQVVSRVASAMHAVTSIDADYIPDTQRRRRNKLSSTRHSAPVTAD